MKIHFETLGYAVTIEITQLDDDESRVKSIGSGVDKGDGGE